jgi:CheY-like chemotaxis protein
VCSTLLRTSTFTNNARLPTIRRHRSGYYSNVGTAPSILIVDDSSDDFILLMRALMKAGVVNPLHWVRSGGEAIQYLNGTGPYSNRNHYPLPSVILLDLNMPDGDGFEVLTWIRNKYPSGGLLVVVLTRVEEIKKINRAYALGANSFLTKPGNVEELQELVSIFSGYWLLNNRPPQPDTKFPFPSKDQ